MLIKRVSECRENFTGEEVAQLNFSISELNHNKGCIALEMNDPGNALKSLKRFNDLMMAELDGQPMLDDMRLAISWNELGNAHMLNQEWLEGEKCFERSISEMQALKNYEPTMISLPITNSGFASWFQGKYEEARRTLEEALHVREVAFGEGYKGSFV